MNPLKNIQDLENWVPNDELNVCPVGLKKYHKN